MPEPKAQPPQAKPPRKSPSKPALTAAGRCLCGAVEIEIAVPVRWAWHDHSPSSRRAHGAAYATYVGAWRSRVAIVKGRKAVARYEDAEARSVRSFCARCGSPLMYERAHAPQMINLPRALFDVGIGREPRYHAAIGELREWAYLGERLTPLRGYPGIVWDGGRRKKRVGGDIA